MARGGNPMSPPTNGGICGRKVVPKGNYWKVLGFDEPAGGSQPPRDIKALGSTRSMAISQGVPEIRG